MRISQPDRTRLQPRSRSPYAAKNRALNHSATNVSVHSEHLWNMMEEMDLFPEEIYQLLRYEERNLSAFKKSIEREKQKVALEIENIKKEIIHNIDDLKITIDAELDGIYRHYMEKYATLKGEIMEIKRLKDDLEIDMDRRSNYIPKFRPSDRPDHSYSGNVNIMKSIQQNQLEVKKSQMIKYISQLQKEKIIPLADLTKEIIILTQYENGFYQNKEFQQISGAMLNVFKGNLRNMHENKYQYIRRPQHIYVIEEKPILGELYEEQPQTQQIFTNYQSPQNYQSSPTYLPAQGYTLNPPTPQLSKRVPMSRLDQPTRPANTSNVSNISTQQQSLAVDFAQNVNLTQAQSLKSISNDIILCSVQVGKNIIAMGSKDGSIVIYEVSSGQRVANLKGHKASICKLAMINNNGKRYLASGSDCGCSSIVLWDINTWNMKMKIQSNTAAVTAIVDLMDNRSLISGSYDKTINVYNLNSEGQFLFNLPANKTQVTALLLNSNGSKLISCGLDNTLSVYNITRGQRYVETMFLQRNIQNNTMICSLVASNLNPELLFLGSKDGKIKLINIERGEAYRTHSVCNNAIIEMVIIERHSKPDLPIALCWPCKEECIKVVNTETGRVTNTPSKGYIQFGCGIGPKAYFLSSGKHLAMLSQAQDRRQVNLFKIDSN